MPDTAIVWFRRDLRVDDLPALAHACREHERIVAALRPRSQASARPLPLARSHCVAARVPCRARRRAARAGSAAGGAPRPPGDRGAARGARGRRRDRARLRRRDRLRALARRPRGGGARTRRGRLAPPPRPLRGRPAADRDGPGRPLQGLHALPARVARPGAPRAGASAAHDHDGAGRGGRAALPARAGLRRARAAPAGPARAGPGRGTRAPPGAGCAAPRWSATPSAATSWPCPPRASRPTCASAACRRCRSSAGWPREVCSATATSSRGATSSPPYSCTSLRARASSWTRATAPWNGIATPLSSTPGARGARAFPSSMPRCASSSRPAGCTTARG